MVIPGTKKGSPKNPFGTLFSECKLTVNSRMFKEIMRVVTVRLIEDKKYNHKATLSA